MTVKRSVAAWYSMGHSHRMSEIDPATVFTGVISAITNYYRGLYANNAACALLKAQKNEQTEYPQLPPPVVRPISPLDGSSRRSSVHRDCRDVIPSEEA